MDFGPGMGRRQILGSVTNPTHPASAVASSITVLHGFLERFVLAPR